MDAHIQEKGFMYFNTQSANKNGTGKLKNTAHSCLPNLHVFSHVPEDQQYSYWLYCLADIFKFYRVSIPMSEFVSEHQEGSQSFRCDDCDSYHLIHQDILYHNFKKVEKETCNQFSVRAKHICTFSFQEIVEQFWLKSVKQIQPGQARQIVGAQIL